jgi:hypothetical protein
MFNIAAISLYFFPSTLFNKKTSRWASVKLFIAFSSLYLNSFSRKTFSGVLESMYKLGVSF